MVVGHCVGVMVEVLVVGPGGRQRDVIGVGVQHAADLAEAVVGKEEEETIPQDGAADRAAELLLLVNGLGQQEWRGSVVESLELAVRIERIEVGITQVVERIAVELVGAALGDRVHLTACSLTELDGVVEVSAWNSLMESME